MALSPTKVLHEEHGGILLMLGVIGEIDKRMASGQEVNREHLTEIVGFLENFADKCHHGKEEGILFPELKNTPSNQQLISKLKSEHAQSRVIIKNIKTLLESADAENLNKEVPVNFAGYIDLLKNHIKTETEMLFPIADNELSDSDKNRIVEKFEDLEENVIGMGRHEEYHLLLKELKEIYLG